MCINTVFRQNESFRGISNHVTLEILYRIRYTCKVFRRYVFSYVQSEILNIIK